MTTDPTDEELLKLLSVLNDPAVQAWINHTMDWDEQDYADADPKATFSDGFAAGRESVAPRITREDVDRIVRETIAIVNGWPGHGGRFMTPDLTDAVLSALGMTEGDVQ